MIWLALGVILFMIIGGMVDSILDHKLYNNGNCTCGGKFESFALDSQGGTGWNCSKCDNSFWTSYVKAR